jgi:hypothetical protein
MLKAEMHNELRSFLRKPEDSGMAISLNNGETQYCVHCAKDHAADIAESINLGDTKTIDVYDWWNDWSEIEQICDACGFLLNEEDFHDDAD